jgi:hypothetical protein
MCFSAEVSFTAAVVLGGVGVAVITKVRDIRELPLAAVPLVFAAQQAIEGYLWRTVPDGRDHSLWPANLFATIALIIWPLLIPAAIALVERDVVRRLAMLVLLPAGIGVAVNYAAIMLIHPYRAWPVGHSLTYVNNHPISPVMLGLYVVCACLPPLLSSSRALQLFGVIVITGLAITFAAFYESFLSVWCFFAALASIIIWGFFRTRQTIPRNAH